MKKVLSISAAATLLAAAATFTASCDDDEEEGAYVGVWDIAYRIPASSGVDDLADFWFNSPSDGWACGDVYVLNYVAGRWTVFAQLDLEVALKYGGAKAVCALAPDDVWVGGQFETSSDENVSLFHYDGDKWEAVDVGGAWVDDIYFFGPNRGWVAGQDGVFYYDGNSWTKQLDGDASSLGFLGADFGWVLLENPTFNVYLWDGVGWRPEGLEVYPPDGLNAVDFSSRDEGWATGYYYNGGHTSDFVMHKVGGSWNSAGWPSGAAAGPCDFLSATCGWVGSTGACYYYDGTGFEIFALPEIGYLQMGAASLWVNSPNDAWLGSRAHFAGGPGYSYILHFSGFDG